MKYKIEIETDRNSDYIKMVLNDYEISIEKIEEIKEEK